MDLRCRYKLHARVIDGRIEVRCRSTFCGHQPGVIVLHQFDPVTGLLVQTLKFRDPVGNEHEEGGEQPT